MVDTRFHHPVAPLALAELLTLGGHGDLTPGSGAGEALIQGANELHIASEHEIVFAASAGYRKALQSTRAAAVIVIPALAGDVPPGCLAVQSEKAHEVFVDLLHVLFPSDTKQVIEGYVEAGDGGALIEEGVVRGPGVVIGRNAEIGRGTVIGANSVIGAGVTIGRNCVIGPHCSIECAHLGDGVVLQAGVRIGTEGFGFLDPARRNRKIPQLGRVIIQDRVEIGANSAIDRGALGDTSIGEGTKIDNLVQIAHNCVIGRNCVISGNAGLAGSTVLEDSVVIAGGVGISGHLTVGRGTVVYGASVVSKSCPPGSRLAGYPAQDIKVWRREVVRNRLMAKGAKDDV